MKSLLTPKQVARAIGVSESSLKRWCDKGILATVRTAGGHRRIALTDVMAFLRSQGRQPVRPEILGLPAPVGTGETVVGRATEQLFEVLSQGNEEATRRILADLYLAKVPLHDVFDRVVSPAMHRIGACWEKQEIKVYQEHFACEIVYRALFELRDLLPPVPETAPHALGGTFEGDPYRVPTTMVELVLREQGWKADSLGPQLPIATICDVVQKVRPRLFWLSVSSLQSPTDFVAQFDELHSAATRCGTAVVVGGRALTEEIRKQIRYSAFCDNLRHLVTFVGTLGLEPAQSA